MNKNHSTQQLSLEAIRYPQFYLSAGIRKAQALKSPKFSNLLKFEPPKESLFHYINESNVLLGPPEFNFMSRNHEGQVYIDHVYDLIDPIDNPRRLGTEPKTYRDNYHRSVSNKMRRVVKFGTANAVIDSLMLINYSLIHQIYEYRPKWNTKISTFRNLLSRAVIKANELVKISNRNQFFIIQTPEYVPGKMDFRKVSDGESKITLSNFQNYDSLFLLEIWKFISKNPESSILSNLSEEALDKVDIMFTDGISYTVLSLKLLHGWKEGEEGDAELRSEDLQFNFLEFLNKLSQVRALAQVDDNDLESKSELEELMDDRNEVTVDEDGEIVESDPEIQTKVIDVKITERDKIETQDKLVRPIEEVTQYFMEQGAISPKQRQRYNELAEGYKKIPDPFNSGLSLEELTVYDQYDYKLMDYGKLPEKTMVVDESMLQSRLAALNSQYIEKTYKKDIINVIMSLQKGNNIIRDIKVERQLDVNNDIFIVNVEVESVGGGKSTIPFKVPNFKADGSYRSGGVNYFFRKQRGDVPIRKDKPYRVFCTSYASKLSIIRSQMKKNSLDSWLMQTITNLSLDTSHPLKITSSKSCFDHTAKLPRMYTAFSKFVETLKCGQYEFHFNHKRVDKLVDENILKNVIDSDEFVIGVAKSGSVLTIDTNGYVTEGGETIGHIFELLKIPEVNLIKRAETQVEAAQIKILGKKVPLVMVVSYNYGLERLLTTLDAKYRRVAPGGRLELQWDEYPIRFKDVTLVFKRSNHLVEMLMGGLWSERKIIQKYDLEDFNNNEVWAQVCALKGLKPRNFRELQLLYDMWIDPITERALKHMGEPTEFRALMMRALEMLSEDFHTKDAASKSLRFKGNERIPGAIYSEFYSAERMKRTRVIGPKHKLEVNPHAIWMSLEKDPSKQIMEESNPIQNLKELENTTFGGTGGKAGNTMVRRTREFDPDDIGTISEATVDSKDVAVTTFMVPDPNIDSMLGFVSDVEVSKSETGKLISTSMLLSAFSDSDDAKRANFINIQQSHVVACKGYTTSPIRTGYEHVVGHRHTNDLFTMQAKGDGVVTAVTSKRVTVKYDNPELGIDHFEVTRKYGTVTGKTVPHDIVTDMVVGDRVFKNFIVAWNVGFYERDFFSPGGVVWKQGIPVRVAFMDGPESIEDCARMSTRLSDELEINTTGLRSITTNFEDYVKDMVQVGDVVDVDSDLCFIESPVTGENSLFDETDITTLRGMGRNRPKAKYMGTVSKIEVIYNGDLDDMSPGLRELVERSDKERARRVREFKLDEATTGQVPDLQLDTAEIRIYIDSTNGAADGDKIVLNHQLKMVPGSIMVGTNVDEDGREIDLIVAWQTVADRIVLSPIYLGLCSMACELATKRAIAAFDKVMGN